MFGIGRRKTQGQLAKAELNRGVGHLMQAANHAAKGAGATVGPRVRTARSAVAPAVVVVRDRTASGWGSTMSTLAPLAVTVRGLQAGPANRKARAKQAEAARKVKAKNMKAKKKSRRGGGMMTGLLAAGTVAGLAGAMAMRRRREQQEWAEYDPTGKLEPMRDEVETLEVTTPRAGDASTMSGGPTGAGSSAVAGGTSASATPVVAQPKIHPNDKVPSVAEGARDVSGRPADDVTEALEKGAARSSGRR